MSVVFYIFTVTISIPLKMSTIIFFKCVNIVDQSGPEIHIYINKKQNDYQNTN